MPGRRERAREDRGWLWLRLMPRRRSGWCFPDRISGGDLPRFVTVGPQSAESSPTEKSDLEPVRAASCVKSRGLTSSAWLRSGGRFRCGHGATASAFVPCRRGDRAEGGGLLRCRALLRRIHVPRLGRRRVRSESRFGKHRNDLVLPIPLKSQTAGPRDR